MVGAGGLLCADLLLLRRRGGAARLKYGPVRPCPCGVNYGLIALGMSAGSLLSYAGSQLLDLPARHMLAVASAVAGRICFLFVKPVATVEKQQGNG